MGRDEVDIWKMDVSENRLRRRSQRE